LRRAASGLRLWQCKCRAIIGAYYCNGYSPLQILEVVKDISVIKAFRLTRSPGLLKLDQAENIFREHLKATKFEQLKIPLYISAVNVKDAKLVYFSAGELIKPLLGSISLPPLFRPVSYQGLLLADGGLINNLPVEPVKDFQAIIGVNVNIVKPPPENFIQYAEWVGTVLVVNNIRESIPMCDIFIEPPAMRDFRITQIGKADELFEAGYDYARTRLRMVQDKVQALLEIKSSN
jgi:NTE family protein